MFRQLELLHRVLNDQFTSTLELTTGFATLHAWIMLWSFCVLKIYKTASLSIFFAFPILIMVIVIGFLVYILSFISSVAQLMRECSATFLRSYKVQAGARRTLRGFQSQSFRPLELSHAFSLKIDRPTLALVMHDITLNGLLTLLLNFR